MHPYIAVVIVINEQRLSSNAPGVLVLGGIMWSAAAKQIATKAHSKAQS